MQSRFAVRSLHKLLIPVVVFWWAFAFSFLVTELLVDDFEHLSRAQQLLAGELPDRDFYDDGRPLTIGLAVAAQYINPTLFSERVYRSLFIAAGMAFLYLITRNLTRSTVLGVIVAFLTIGTQPKLYNYPKIFVFPLGLWLLWEYIDRPTRPRLIALTLGTVCAFLFRHDYGLYLAVVSICTIAGVYQWKAVKPLTLYAAIGLTICLPYLTWLVVQGRLLPTGSKGASAMATKSPLFIWYPPRLDLSRGLVYIAPVEHHVVVRWRADVDLEARKTLEDRYGLKPVETKTDGRSVVYIFENPTPAQIGRLLSDPRVQDTGGIDRGTGNRLDPPPDDRRAAAFPLLRLRAATLFHSKEDTEGWLVNLFMFSVPLAGAVVLLFPETGVQHERAKILSLALLLVLIQHFLFIDKVRAHLPNVAGPSFVLAAWLARRSLDALSSLKRPLTMWVARSAWTVAALVLLCITWSSVAVFAETHFSDVVAALVTSPQEFVNATRALNRRPLDYWTNEASDGRKGFIRYVERCLEPDDRLFMAAYAPDVYYVAGRLFAGGINAYHDNGFNSSSADILRRFRGQSIPLVVVQTSDGRFPAEWADVGQYIASRYREVAVIPEDPAPMRVLADTQRSPRGMDRRTGLPCYVDAP